MKKVFYIQCSQHLYNHNYLTTILGMFKSKRKAERFVETMETELAVLDKMLWDKEKETYRKATEEEMYTFAPTMKKLGFSDYSPNICELDILECPRF